MIKHCPVCNSIDIDIVYKNKQMPYGIKLINKFIDIEVAICKTCSFVFQCSSYCEEYDKNIELLYKNYKISDMYNFPNRSIHHLKALNFISSTIQNNIDYNILEIGSNRGDFLYLLKEKFSNINILGCEPTDFKDLFIPTINSFFDKNLFSTKFDLVIIRHTLEHIKYPKVFIKELKYILKEGAFVFVEVPNLIYSLNNFIEDYTPDHVNYFYKDSLDDCFDEYKAIKYDNKEFLYSLFQIGDKNKKIKGNQNKQ
ncbi:MAG: class I SAM-dependent methyltransferase, partial [Campylobacterota bacterium]|nr:class I SAM-dependent methyltransferase [Campylobacterota bacterium]